MNLKEIKYDSADYKESLKLRFKILRKPLELDFSEDFLADESNNFHLAAFENNELIAVVLLRPICENELKMRQFAVSEKFQRKGIGKMLTQFAEKFALKNKYNFITLYARKTAVGFYEKLGYHIVDEEFIEVGIPHFKMEKKL
jgi:ribosomal protein S18 acetylase RimI-like enzyme